MLVNFYVAIVMGRSEVVQAESVDAVIERCPWAELLAGPTTEDKAQQIHATWQAVASGTPAPEAAQDVEDVPIVRLGSAQIGETLAGAPRVLGGAVSISDVYSPPAPRGSAPRNRKERRAAAKFAKKLAAAQKRLVHEDRYTQAAELAEVHRVNDWSDLDEDDRKEVLEQADQSRDRW